MTYLFILSSLMLYVAFGEKVAPLRIDSNVAAVFTPFTTNGTINYSVTTVEQT